MDAENYRKGQSFLVMHEENPCGLLDVETNERIGDFPECAHDIMDEVTCADTPEEALDLIAERVRQFETSDDKGATYVWRLKLQKRIEEKAIAWLDVLPPNYMDAYGFAVYVFSEGCIQGIQQAADQYKDALLRSKKALNSGDINQAQDALYSIEQAMSKLNIKDEKGEGL